MYQVYLLQSVFTQTAGYIGCGVHRLASSVCLSCVNLFLFHFRFSLNFLMRLFALIFKDRYFGKLYDILQSNFIAFYVIHSWFDSRSPLLKIIPIYS